MIIPTFIKKRFKSISKGKLLEAIKPDTWFILDDLDVVVSPDSFQTRAKEMGCFEIKKKGRVNAYKISEADRELHIDMYYTRQNQDREVKQKIVKYKQTKEDKLFNLMMGA